MSNPTERSDGRRHSIAWRLALALGAVFLVIGLVSVSCLWAIFDIHHRLHSPVDQRDAATATVDVHDTGPGMTAEARERALEPFFTPKAAGSGLGLAISQAIARAHGGDISVVSSTPPGSTFRLTIPSQKKTEA